MPQQTKGSALFSKGESDIYLCVCLLCVCVFVCVCHKYKCILRVYLRSAYFAKIKNLVIKITIDKVKIS